MNVESEFSGSEKFSPISYHEAKSLDWIWFPSLVRGNSSTKNEVDRFNIFLDILLTDISTE